MRDSIELPPEPRAAGTARHFVFDHVCPHVGADVAETAMLLTSELVTNVIVHARTPMRLDVDVTDEAVRVAVVDDAARTPAIRRAHEARLTGRGMNLVETLASQWGVEPNPPGKKVWFELSA
ncbi:MAG TPA: ATP-binding protein [Frankiaceae bacterium]|nr:ATP-binding protein [Frankiaceae bacterium]